MKNLLRRGVSGLLAVVFAFTLSVKCLSPKAYAITPVAALAAVSLASFCSGFCFSLGADAEELAWSYLFDGTEEDYVASLDNSVVANSDIRFSPAFGTYDVSSLEGYISSYSDNLPVSFSFIASNATSSSYGSYGFDRGCYFYSVPFSVSETASYIIDMGTLTRSTSYSASGRPFFQCSTDGGSTWSTVLSNSNNSTWDNYKATDTVIYSYSGFSERQCVAQTVSRQLVSGELYRFGVFWERQYSSNSFPIGLEFKISFDVPPSIYRSGVTVVPDSTRPSGLSASINSYNSGDNSTNYYIGTIAEDGSVVNTYNFDLFNESTMTVKNPSTGDSWTVTSWEYDYTTRSYDCITADGETISITYGDDYITFMYPDSDGVFHKDYYYYVVSEYNGSSSGSDCDHAYTSETTLAPTCTQAGERTYTCALCGYSYVDAVPATGHDWETTERVDTETNGTGDVTILGYTVYTCSSCGEIYKAYDQDGQPTSPPGASTPSENDSILGWLSDFRSWLETTFATLFQKLDGSSESSKESNYSAELEESTGVSKDSIKDKKTQASNIQSQAEGLGITEDTTAGVSTLVSMFSVNPLISSVLAILIGYGVIMLLIKKGLN